jgi:Ca2+-transporting ATPase
MILVLLVAAVISGVVGELRDTIAILVIVLLNAVVGAIQEYRAQRAVAALRQMAAPEASVVRDGETKKITATQVVPGDVVILEAGDVVPADLRLIELTDLKVDESALTGESLAVEKSSDALEGPDLVIGDRRNMAYKATSVTRGRAKGVVVATGADTELGRIAEMLRKEGGAKTPLQLRLARFGRHLAFAILAICAVVFSRRAFLRRRTEADEHPARYQRRGHRLRKGCPGGGSRQMRGSVGARGTDRVRPRKDTRAG